MHKFRFKLEGVLSVKRRLEDQAKAEFGAAMQALHAEEEKRDLVIARINSYEEKLCDLLSGRLNMRDIASCESALSILKEELEERKKAVKRAENRVELCRTKLNNCIKERKTIEKLREKKFDEYVREFNDEEHKQVDELVSYRHTCARG